MLHDPPEVKQYAKQGDPAMSDWPGVPVERRALMEAAGDPRDWFRYGHRLQAYQQAWYAFMDARRRRRFDTGFEWNRILVLGDYGAGKTSLAIKIARYWSPVSEHEPATCEALYCQLSNATGVVHD